MEGRPSCCLARVGGGYSDQSFSPVSLVTKICDPQQRTVKPYVSLMNILSRLEPAPVLNGKLMPHISARPSLVYEPVHPSGHLSAYISICSSYLSIQTYTIHLPTYPFIYLMSSQLPVHPALCPFSHLSIHYSFIRPPTHPSMYSPIYPYIH